jgi:hypothetical protein
MPSVRLLLAVLAVSLTMDTVAFCQPRDRAAAEALFQAGRDAVQRGDYAVACEKFRESNRLDPAVGTLLNLADCSEHVGKLATAWELFREVEQRLGPNDDRVPIARGRSASLEKRLPRLSLGPPPGAPAGLVVFRDGVELGAASFDVPLPADPGEHVVLVRAPDRIDSEMRVTLGPAEQKHITLTLGDPVAASSSSSSSSVDVSATATSRGRTTGYVIGGIGALGLATGLVTGAMALTAKHTVDLHCNNKPNRVCDTDDAYQAGARGKALATASTVAFAVGVLGVGVGSYLILSHKGTQTTALAASVLPDGGFVGMVGQF